MQEREKRWEKENKKKIIRIQKGQFENLIEKRIEKDGGILILLEFWERASCKL